MLNIGSRTTALKQKMELREKTTPRLTRQKEAKMPQKEDKAQESRDKLGYLGNSENTKVTPEQYENRCCEHDCRKKTDEEINTEEALKILEEDIPALLAEITQEFQPFTLFWDSFTDKDFEDILTLSGETSGESFLLLWELTPTKRLLGKNVANVVELTVQYPGGKFQISPEKIMGNQHFVILGTDTSKDFERKVSPAAIKILYRDLLKLGRSQKGHHAKILEWKMDIEDLVHKRTGLNEQLISNIARRLQRSHLEKVAYKKGLEKAVEGLRDSKSFTKSPQLKELRHELEEILYGRRNLEKWAYEFYNN